VNLLVLTPESTLLEEAGVKRVRIPLSDGGSIGIRPGHHPLLAETHAGELAFGEDGYTQGIHLQAGILHVMPDVVTIYTAGLLSDSADVEADPNRLDDLTEELEEQMAEGL